MKRKIAAIFAADIAGYSRLVAEDEEETLRRLASYRSVMDDFIARAGGRIFNTAGDAVLAEFPSAVEAVRCAIDIQESLRTRNLAYPSSRQMSFRIGITIGDVVERDGDLLGDGANIAARLEGIAPVGGICISRTVHEQVANKLSVQFADIGEQQVKNIPTPIHAYKIEMRQDDGRIETPPAKKPAAPAKSTAWIMATAIAAAGVLVIGVAATAYLVMSRNRSPQTDTPQTAIATMVERTTPGTAAEQTAPRGERASQTAVMEQKTAPYLPGHKPKALAVASAGGYGFYLNQESVDEAARRALEFCGGSAGVPCLIVAVDDEFVVPIPATMKPVGLFSPRNLRGCCAGIERGSGAASCQRPRRLERGRSRGRRKKSALD